MGISPRPWAARAALVTGLATVAVLGGCGTPWAALPAAVGTQQRDAVATPTGNGSHYVMVESGPRTPTRTLAKTWKRKATRTCKGEYVVLSERAATRNAGGLLASRIHEGYVRCLSPEAGVEEPDPKAAGERQADPQSQRTSDAAGHARGISKPG